MTTPNGPVRRRAWRRLRCVAAVLLLLLVAAIAALPPILGTQPAGRRLLAQINAVLAPGGRLEVAEFRFSWFGPTRMSGFVLKDARGEPIVSAPLAVWDRSLGRILFDRPRYGTLTLDHAQVALDRDSDGSIDLEDALAPILVPDPRAELTICVREGALRLRSPELARPMEAGRLDATIRRARAPGLLTWRVALAGASGNPVALTIHGDADPWKARPGEPMDLTVLLEGERWPLELADDLAGLRAGFDGKLRIARRGGLWSTTGDARLESLQLNRRSNEASRLTLDRIGGIWDASQTPDGWIVRSLDVNSPLGSIHAAANFQEPIGPESAPKMVARIEGDLDLAALSTVAPGLMPTEGRLESGRARLSLATTAANVLVAESREPRVVRVAYQADSPPAPPLPPGAEIALEGTIDLDGLLWSGQGGELEVPPLALAVRAAYRADRDAIDLEDLTVAGPLGTLRASGLIDDVSGRPVAELRGNLDADWSALREQIAKRVDPEIYLDGGPVEFRLAGPIDGGPNVTDIWRNLAIETRVDLSVAEAYGLHAGPLTLSARAIEGTPTIDPIHTRVNGGDVELFPELDVADDGWMTLRLSPLSRAENVEINDVVSQRVLSYVAPIMAQATRARGRVSASISKAEFPLDLGGTESTDPPRSSVVEGLVVFEDVAFQAGPLADDLLDLVKAPGDRILRLDQPVVLAIADGKVHQTGLAIPIANVTRIEMEGTVGFDQTLDVRTTIAMNGAMLGERVALGAIVEGVRITIPLTGTLERPKLDKEAFGAEMAAMGIDLLERSAVIGGVELLRKILTPRDPEDAARRQAERERSREERRLKQEERRRLRDG